MLKHTSSNGEDITLEYSMDMNVRSNSKIKMTVKTVTRESTNLDFISGWTHIIFSLESDGTGFNLDNDGKLDALLSWVHFLKVPEQKCFKFTDSEGNNSFYPDEQNSGDIIYFPSWAYHEIDPNRSDDLRVVIAGNITVTECLD